jgi:AcrR family transcriptional regulator
MTTSKSGKRSYHHGNLAESLLDAVDELATRFGLEAVSLRGCARLVGVAPSSAFRHYADKRALLTAFATRALTQLSEAMGAARVRAEQTGGDRLRAVGLAYVEFAIDKPAFFRAMWHQEAIYSNDPDYVAAASRLSQHLMGGFADTIADENPDSFSPQELLAWSAVHGLASLLVDGPVAKDESRARKMTQAAEMLEAMGPVFGPRQ